MANIQAALSASVTAIVADRQQERPLPRRVVGFEVQNALDQTCVLDHLASLADSENQWTRHSLLAAISPHLVQ